MLTNELTERFIPMNKPQFNAESHPLNRAFAYLQGLSKTAMTPQCVIKLSSPGYVAIIDEADRDLVTSRPWTVVHPRGGRPYTAYARTTQWDKITKRYSTVYLHTLLLATTTGDVDHIDGDGLNNRRSNLRPATRSQNQANRGKQANNTTGYKGVCRVRGRWVAQIQVRGKGRHIGMYDTAEMAARAYDQAAVEAWGEFARTNFPIEP